MKEYIKIKNEQHLVKDPKSKAILNTNIEGLAAYKKRKQTYVFCESWWCRWLLE